MINPPLVLSFEYGETQEADMRRFKDAGARQIQRDLASRKYAQRVVRNKKKYTRKGRAS